MIAMASWLYSKLLECQKEAGNDPDKLDVPYALIVTTLFLYTLQNLGRAAVTIFKSYYNQDQALIESKLVSEDKLNLINSSNYRRAASLLDAGTYAAINISSGLFAKDQFNSGVAALWSSLAGFVFSSLLKMKHGRDSYKVITEEEYKGGMSRAQQVALGLGMATVAGGGIAFAIINHMVQNELKNGGDNPHQLPALAAQAVLIAGLDILALMPRFRNAEAIESALDVIAAKSGEQKSIGYNRATLFGKSTRRDVTELGLATLNTGISAGLVTFLARGDSDTLSLLPVLGAAMALSFAAHKSANKVSHDVDEVTARIKDPTARSINPNAPVAIEIVHDNQDNNNRGPRA